MFGLSSAENETRKETGRVEALSDGVIAIIITLLTFSLHVPTTEEIAAAGGLLAALGQNWPVYVAFLVSFLNLLVMWMNHHYMFTLIYRVDRAFLMLNGLLLLTMSLVPFATSLITATRFTDDGREAAVVYAVIYLAIALAYWGVWGYASARDRLLGPGVTEHDKRAITRRYIVGPVLYPVALVLAAINPLVSLLILAGMSLWFAVPIPWLDRQPAAVTGD
jgi:uncharacterized membrane protein